ncbi:hypothetical protein PYW07_003128 [Mythimna separata]|uniref:THAP-type domain-containing protein n=1 Tax=Mythimna separata TaxID=271217 RepID=A0AAD8DQZ3_MYTSE|nr:hypothetical protein PYW07_003128 [Mythimna separata]
MMNANKKFVVNESIKEVFDQVKEDYEDKWKKNPPNTTGLNDFEQIKPSANEERRKTWVELIGRPDLARPETKPKSHYVCCLHFEKSAMIYIPQLRPDALPTKLLPSLPTTSSASTEPKCKEMSTQTR